MQHHIATCIIINTTIITVITSIAVIGRHVALKFYLAQQHREPAVISMGPTSESHFDASSDFGVSLQQLSAVRGCLPTGATAVPLTEFLKWKSGNKIITVGSIFTIAGETTSIYCKVAQLFHVCARYVIFYHICTQPSKEKKGIVYCLV